MSKTLRLGVFEYYYSVKNQKTWPKAFVEYWGIDDQDLAESTDQTYYGPKISQYTESLVKSYPKYQEEEEIENSE